MSKQLQIQISLIELYDKLNLVVLAQFEFAFNIQTISIHILQQISFSINRLLKALAKL